MKKIIFINIALIFIIGTTLLFCCLEFISLSNNIDAIISLNKLVDSPYNEITQYEYDLYYQIYIDGITKSSIYGVIALIAFILCVLSLIFLNKNKLFSLKGITIEEWNAFKERRAARKAQKTAEQKQARIAELESELNELKKDE